MKARGKKFVNAKISSYTVHNHVGRQASWNGPNMVIITPINVFHVHEIETPLYRVKTMTMLVAIVLSPLKEHGGIGPAMLRTWMAAISLVSMSPLLMESTGMHGKATATPSRPPRWSYAEQNNKRTHWQANTQCIVMFVENNFLWNIVWSVWFLYFCNILYCDNDPFVIIITVWGSKQWLPGMFGHINCDYVCHGK